MHFSLIKLGYVEPNNNNDQKGFQVVLHIRVFRSISIILTLLIYWSQNRQYSTLLIRKQNFFTIIPYFSCFIPIFFYYCDKCVFLFIFRPKIAAKLAHTIYDSDYSCWRWRSLKKHHLCSCSCILPLCIHQFMWKYEHVVAFFSSMDRKKRSLQNESKWGYFKIALKELEISMYSQMDSKTVESLYNEFTFKNFL